MNAFELFYLKIVLLLINTEQQRHHVEEIIYDRLTSFTEPILQNHPERVVSIIIKPSQIF